MNLKIPQNILNLESTSCPKDVLGFCEVCQDGPSYDDLCDRGRATMHYFYKYCEEHNLEGWEEGDYE